MTPELTKRLYDAKRFDTWTEAFDACRERNRPIDVAVPTDLGMEYAEIFPSGHAKTLYAATTQRIVDDRNFYENPCDFSR